MLMVFLGSKIVLMFLSFLCVCVCSKFSAVAYKKREEEIPVKCALSLGALHSPQPGDPPRRLCITGREECLLSADEWGPASDKTQKEGPPRWEVKGRHPKPDEEFGREHWVGATHCASFQSVLVAGTSCLSHVQSIALTRPQKTKINKFSSRWPWAVGSSRNEPHCYRKFGDGLGQVSRIACEVEL